MGKPAKGYKMFLNEWMEREIWFQCIVGFNGLTTLSWIINLGGDVSDLIQECIQCNNKENRLLTMIVIPCDKELKYYLQM